MSTPKMQTAREAANAFQDGSVIGLGTYRTASNGSSESIKATLAIEFVRHHGLNASEDLDCWMDSKTGALIILPGGGQ